MKGKKFRILKSKDKLGTWYHGEIWRWYFPFWWKFTPYFKNKEEVKSLINNRY